MQAMQEKKASSKKRSCWTPSAPKHLLNGLMNIASSLLRNGFELIAVSSLPVTNAWITFKNPSPNGYYFNTLDCGGSQEASITAIAKSECGIFDLTTDQGFTYSAWVGWENIGHGVANLGPACTMFGTESPYHPTFNPCALNVTKTNAKNGLVGPNTTSDSLMIAAGGLIAILASIGVLVYCRIKRKNRNQLLESKPVNENSVLIERLSGNIQQFNR